MDLCIKDEPLLGTATPAQAALGLHSNAQNPRRKRSRVGNGKKLVAADGRTAHGRRFRDLFDDICGDLGGLDQLSEGQKQLVRRAAMLSAECERQEALWVSGEPFDSEHYGMLTDRIGRVFGRLGLERRSKPVSNAVLEHFSRPPERGSR